MTRGNARTGKRLAVAFALMAAAGPAFSADMGGIKDYGGAGGVPVPAPVPVPVQSADWYIGIVGGGVLVDDSTIEEFGTAMAVREDLDKSLFGGISAGKYLNSSLRMEVAFDFYDDVAVAGPLEQFYSESRVVNGETIVAEYDVTRRDTVKVGRTTAMINMFYDLPLSQRIKPYIGGGIGVSWRSMTRRYHETAECARTTDAADPTFNSDNCAGLPDGLELEYENSGTVETDRFDLALAAMAGLSVAVTPDIIWDNGYQMLWEAGGIDLTADAVNTTSTVSYSNTLQHQFRTGLRFNIN